jgi:conjugative relaxase-like TrwC/TraI family protein
VRHDDDALDGGCSGRDCGVVRVLKISKLGVGGADYYLSVVASGIEDYYAGHGEAPGRWLGAGVGAVGLDGRVDGEVLRGLFEGRVPGVERVVGDRSGRARTPGWDLTFSAPKSVSVVFGVGAPEVTAAVSAAHDRAVVEGLTFLESWGLASRRRVQGSIAFDPGVGMMVAGFRHRTSREEDPQLHTHALVPNVVQRGDGTWGAVDSRLLYRQAKAAGEVYQAVLRSQLTERLGVEWTAVDANGISELATVPTSTRELFSKRRQQIVDALDDRGLSSPAAAQIAALSTRRAKGDVAGTDVLRDRWRIEVVDAGGDLDAITSGLGAVTEPRGEVSVREVRQVNDRLMGAAGLTEKATSFQRPKVTEAWCQSIDPTTIGVTAATVDGLVNRTINDPRIVLLGNDDPIKGNDRRRWSTTELVAVEARILGRVDHGRDRGVAVVDSRRAIDSHTSLSSEQSAMVETITGDGHRIDAVVGVAGSGKTFALGVANDAWRQAGVPVIGVALAKRAALGLQEGSGIESSTIDSLLTVLDRPDSGGVPAGTVLVVDEVGMVPTRTLDRLLEHCGPDVKVVLVGDHHQLPEIGAGGVLRGLVERYGEALPTLRENRRQHDVGERLALADLRDGDVNRGLDWFETNGRVTATKDSATARAAMIDAWWSDRQTVGGSQLLMAERRVDVDRLNMAARQKRADAGEIDITDIVTVGERDYSNGDNVIFARNDRWLDVANAQRGRIVALHHERGEVTVDVGDRQVRVDRDYLDGGDLRLGYAATVHKNQGATCDRAYLLTSDSLRRELGYVGLSRGRNDNRIWTTSDRDTDVSVEVAHGTEPEAPDPLADLRHAMATSGAHHLANDQPADLDPAGIDL